MVERRPRATIGQMPAPDRTPLRRLPALLAALALMAAACGPATPTATVRPSGTPRSTPSPSASPSGPAASPTATPDPATVYAAIEAKVVEIRGMTPKTDVEPQVLDEAELKVRLEKSFHEDNPPELVTANELLLKGMGLFPEDASLSGLYLELLGRQVAGFYSPEDDELYVVSRTGASASGSG